jgi:hypothetical protein
MVKLFTSEDGKLQMFIPVDWQYKNPSFYKGQSAPESFGKYDKMLGAFQVSCKLVNDHIKTIIAANELEIQSSEVDHLDFVQKLVESHKTHNFMWLAAVEDHFIIVTYILGSRQHNTKKGKLEFEQVFNALKNIKFIKPQFRNSVIAQNRFNLFMSSIAATIDLRNRAIDNGSFIEYIVLTANHIDAMLRSAIILTNQLENGNKDIDTSILFQSETDKPIIEKEIYKRALDKKIIDQTLFDELFLLYNDRNKVVHRYIITDIRTEEILEIAMKYDKIDVKINSILNALEKRQFDLGIGLYAGGVEPGQEVDSKFLERLKFQIRDKHGRINLSNSLTNNWVKKK